MAPTRPYLPVPPHYWSEEDRVYLSSIYHHSRRSPNSIEGYSDNSIAELMNKWAGGEVEIYTRFKVRDEMLKPEFQRLLNQRIELAKISPPRPQGQLTRSQARQPLSGKCHFCAARRLICDNAKPRCSSCAKRKRTCKPYNSGTLAARDHNKAQNRASALRRKNLRLQLEQGNQEISCSGSQESQGLILPVSPGSGPFPLLPPSRDPNAWYPPSGPPPPDPRVEEYYHRNRHSFPDNNTWRPPTGCRPHVPMSDIDKDFWYSPNNGPAPPPRDPNGWYPPEPHF